MRRDGNLAMAGSLGSSPDVTVSDLGNPTCKPLELFICLFSCVFVVVVVFVFFFFYVQKANK